MQYQIDPQITQQLWPETTNSAITIANIRQILIHSQQTLQNLFANGVEISQLVHARSWLIDKILAMIWQHYFPENSDMILIACGGYGRGELHPYSDIDLMLISITTLEYNTDIEKFITFLWDLNLKIGHAVYTIDEAKNYAQKDITIATTLMEARLLQGERSLFTRLQIETDADHIWQGQRFFLAKQQEQQQRYMKYDSLSNLEPNIKEAPGGLRDIQTIAWVAKRHFGATYIKDLVFHQFLTEAEYQILINAQTWLWQVRFILHSLNQRAEDRLLFEYQKIIAEKFAYTDNHLLAVEQFMQKYYQIAHQVIYLSEMLLQLFEENILKQDQTYPIEPINSRFQIKNCHIETTHANTFEKHPSALLEIFLLLQTHPHIKGVRANTIRSIHQHLNLIDDNFRQNDYHQHLFISLFRQAKGITHELRRMHRYGVLSAYLPVFAKIVGRMQYDLFHTYTVDEHLLFVVRNLRRFALAEFNHEFPLCSNIMQDLVKPELLYLAGLFHDIAKGRGSDHSEAGAEETQLFCQQHGLSKYDTNLVVWLVKSHLVFSLTAQRQDISDPKVIQDFAQFVGDEIHLNYLYLLTMADIRSTNPNLLTSWKQALLQELYLSTKQALQRGLANPIDLQDYISEKQQDVLKQLLIKPDILLKDIQSLWQTLDENYFIRYQVDEICWHTPYILHRDKKQPLILVHQHAKGGVEIFLYIQHQDYLFSIATALIDQLQFNVVNARITTTTENYQLASYLILERDPTQKVSLARKTEILDKLAIYFQQKPLPLIKKHYKMPRIMQQFDIPTRVHFWCNPKADSTIMELITKDRPGLLSWVGTAFADTDTQLQNAKIATIGLQAEDVFYITNQQGHALNLLEQAKLEKLLRHYLQNFGN